MTRLSLLLAALTGFAGCAVDRELVQLRYRFREGETRSYAVTMRTSSPGTAYQGASAWGKHLSEARMEIKTTAVRVEGEVATLRVERTLPKLVPGEVKMPPYEMRVDTRGRGLPGDAAPAPSLHVHDVMFVVPRSLGLPVLPREPVAAGAKWEIPWGTEIGLAGNASIRMRGKLAFELVSLEGTGSARRARMRATADAEQGCTQPTCASSKTHSTFEGLFDVARGDYLEWKWVSTTTTQQPGGQTLRREAITSGRAVEPASK
jgi:hypothetical protein